MSLYFWINLLSLSVPFLVSFHPRIKLYKNWGALFLSMIIAMVPFIFWDVYFTKMGYWGFNPEYLCQVYWFNLPVEEWLFFICIPYACIFTHLALIELSDKWIVKQKTADYISYFLFAFFFLVLVFNTEKMYTLFDMSYAILVLAHVFYWKREMLRKFYLTFLAMLVPFAIVNGVLTGSFIPGEVVWYNDSQNLGIRIATIPIEDFTYAFSMILSALYLFEIFKKKKITN
tara:strand:+ start:4167 stop:4856 length:690 start_codon:yes stop_codon:yes gene_type:complete